MAHYYGRLLSLTSINPLVFYHECHFLLATCTLPTIYLNNSKSVPVEELSADSQLIVAPRKFDVLKTNICPRREALRANMLVLRATIRPIVPRHKHSIVFIVHH